MLLNFKLPVLIIFVCLIIATHHAYAQKLNQKDTSTVFSLYGQAKKFTKTKPDSLSFYLRKAIIYAEKYKVTSYGSANSYFILGGLMYRSSNFSEALSLFEKYQQTAIKLKNNALLYQALNSIANVYIEQGKPDVALSYYLKCLGIATTAKSKKDIAMAYNNIAFVYKDEGKYDEAISNLFKSIDINEAINNQLAIGNNYLQLSVIFLRKADSQSSIKYAQNSLKIFEGLHRDDMASTSHYMLSAAYQELKDTRKARAELEECIKIAKQINDVRGIALNYSRLGDLLYEDAKYDEALAAYKDAMIVMEKIHLQRSLANLYIATGKCLSKTGNFAESEKYLKKGLAEAINNKRAEDVSDAYEGLAALYHAIKTYVAVKDSLMSVQTSNNLAELQTKYETEKKQKQIEKLNYQNTVQGLNLKNQNLQLSQNKLEITAAHLEIDKNKLTTANQQLALTNKQGLLNKKQLESEAKGQKIKLLNKQSTIQNLELAKKNMTIIIIASIFLLFIIISYLFYNRYTLKQAAILQSAVIQQQDIASKRIIEAEEAERKRIAGDLHDGVGQLFSTVKMNLETLIDRYIVPAPDAALLAEKTMAMVDESCTEVRSIAHQMMPNALIKSGLVSAVRDFVNKIHSDRLKISVETKGINERLEISVETVLYRVIQESVNNVIKHANATNLDILLLCDDQEITVTIEDNGKGFDTADQGRFKGIGLKNITSRVEYLKGSVEISSSPGKGTLVAIYVPLA
jgi:two-component system NarL family sensor kinase